MNRKRLLGFVSVLAIAAAFFGYAPPEIVIAQVGPTPVPYPNTFPHSTNTAGPQATAASDALGVVCQYNATAPTLTNASLGVCQMDVNGNLKIAGTFSATVTYPYSGTSSGQTATTQSFLGAGCIYNSTLPTITSAQFAPCQAGIHGEQLISGLGTAGTPVGGVVSVQGVSGGTAIPVTGSFSTVFPYGPTPGPTTAASSGIGVNGCYVSAGVTLTNGQQACLQVNSSGALITTGGGGLSAFPYGPTPGPTTSASFVGITGVYNSGGVSPSNGQAVPLQVDSAGNLHTVGTTANVSFPYSGTAGGQTATGASFLGAGCISNTTAPTPTTGQFVPHQCDASGNLKVINEAAGAPYIPIGLNPTATPTPALFDTNNNLAVTLRAGTTAATITAYGTTPTTGMGIQGVNQAGSIPIAGYTGYGVLAARMDTYGGVPMLNVTTGATNPIGNGTNVIAAGAAGPVVFCTYGCRFVGYLITAAGTTGDVVLYDNASACSGTIVGVIAGTTSNPGAYRGYMGSGGNFMPLTSNGLTACGATGSPAATVNYSK